MWGEATASKVGDETQLPLPEVSRLCPLGQHRSSFPREVSPEVGERRKETLGDKNTRWCLSPGSEKISRLRLNYIDFAGYIRSLSI